MAVRPDNAGPTRKGLEYTARATGRVIPTGPRFSGWAPSPPAGKPSWRGLPVQEVADIDVFDLERTNRRHKFATWSPRWSRTSGINLEASGAEASRSRRSCASACASFLPRKPAAPPSFGRRVSTPARCGQERADQGFVVLGGRAAIACVNFSSSWRHPRRVVRATPVRVPRGQRSHPPPAYAVPHRQCPCPTPCRRDLFLGRLSATSYPEMSSEGGPPDISPLPTRTETAIRRARGSPRRGGATAARLSNQVNNVLGFPFISRLPSTCAPPDHRQISCGGGGAAARPSPCPTRACGLRRPPIKFAPTTLFPMPFAGCCGGVPGGGRAAIQTGGAHPIAIGSISRAAPPQPELRRTPSPRQIVWQALPQADRVRTRQRISCARSQSLDEGIAADLRAGRRDRR